jgi:peptide/nickel transport system substrate-binding protein
VRNKIVALLVLLLVSTIGVSVFGEENILKVSSRDYVASLDPAYMTASWKEFPIMNSIYNGLVKYEIGSFKVEPDLASSWEIAEDGKAITFYIHEGVQFHNGYGELTAEDVKFSFERILNDKSSPDWSAFAALDHVEVIDKYTVKLVLKNPMAQLFSSTLPFNAGLIVSKKAVKEMGKDKFAYNPIGTGPYKLDRWITEGEVVLKKNDNYWNKEEVVANSPDVVEFIPIEDAFARGTAVIAGELDVGEIDLSAVETYKKVKNISVQIMDDMAYWWVSFTVDKPPMDNKKLREALRYIIDPDEIVVGAFDGIAKRTNSMLLPSMVGYWADAPTYNVEDVGRDKVEKLLAEAGYPNGEGLELTFLTGKSTIRKNSAEIIQAQLARYNIDLRIDVLEMGALIEAAKNGDYHLHIGRYSMTPSPCYASQWFKSDEAWNFMQWSNEEYDRLWEESSATMEEDKRGELFIKLQKVMDEDAIAVWVSYGATAWGINTNHVEKVVIQPDSYTVIPWKTEMK